MAQKYVEITELIEHLKRQAGCDPEETFKIILKYKKGITGLAVNIPTEILNTFYPHEFPVLNQRAVDSLNYFGQDVKKDPRSYNGQDYAGYTSFLKQIWKDSFYG